MNYIELTKLFDANELDMINCLKSTNELLKENSPKQLH